MSLAADTARDPGEHPGPGDRGDGSGPTGPGDERPRRRPVRSFVLLRQVDVDSPVHRLWAGTKLLAAAAVSATVSLDPTWPTVALMVALLLGATLAARIPRRAVPRPPLWFWVVIVVGAVLTVFSGGSPEVAVGGAHVGLGGLDSYMRFTLVSFILLSAGTLIGWTTSLGDIGPATGRLLRPFKLLRIPVEEWATAIALCIRSLPLVVEEIRTLVAARRLRPKPPVREGALQVVDEAGDLVVSALSVSLRRAAEMAEAMTARGGTGSITDRAPGPKLRDVVALLIVSGACCAGWLIPS